MNWRHMLGDLDKSEYIGKIETIEYEDFGSEEIIVDIARITSDTDLFGSGEYHFHVSVGANLDDSFVSMYPHICYYTYSLKNKIIRNVITSIDFFTEKSIEFKNSTPELLAEALKAYEVYKLTQIIEK